MQHRFNGILNIDKPEGFTSHDVVAKLRGVLKMKKIGHAGTLDPLATGVLPVCLGYATRAADYIMEGDKVYEADILFGVETDTQDISGEIVKRYDRLPAKEELVATLKCFEGDILQVPPMYSAIKVGGKKLYEIARKGAQVEREPRKVKIYKIELLNFSKNTSKIRVCCSKGTYIRTLCHDLGQKLMCGGCMTSLVRTKNGPFELSEAVALKDISEENINKLLVSPESLFPRLPRIYIEGKNLMMFKNGVMLNQRNFSDTKLLDRQKYTVYSPDGFLALCEGEEDCGEVRLRMKFKVV